MARAHGTRVAVDLSSAAMVASFGADHFSSCARRCGPSVVFATDSEWATSPGAFGAGGTPCWSQARRARCLVRPDGVTDERAALEGPVVDVTGAGDALAAGFLWAAPTWR